MPTCYRFEIDWPTNHGVVPSYVYSLAMPPWLSFSQVDMPDNVKEAFSVKPQPWTVLTCRKTGEIVDVNYRIA